MRPVSVPQSGRWSVTKTGIDPRVRGLPIPEDVLGMSLARAGRPDQTAESVAPHRDTAPRDVMLFPQLTRASVVDLGKQEAFPSRGRQLRHVSR